MNFKMLCGFIK